MAPKLFEEIIDHHSCKRMVFSYSDAPRNTISVDDLIKVCKKRGM